MEAVGDGGEGSDETSRDSIFIPRLVLVVAGMKRVARLLGAGMEIR